MNNPLFAVAQQIADAKKAGAMLVAATYILTVLLLAMLGSCTASRPTTTTSAKTVGRHNYSHDHRTRQREPYSYVHGTNLTITSR